jgi:hypothetical protein
VSKALISQVLSGRQLRSGGWSFFGSEQASTEVSCLSSLALASDSAGSASRGITFLLNSQLRAGDWPSFEGDLEGSWTTALALCCLNAMNDPSDAREKASKWLLEQRGREGHWFWRWKFKNADRNVQFNPDRYGWPWVPGANSWIIPTGFSVIGLKQFTVCSPSEESQTRLRLGVEMILDRACPGGGWNEGNSIVYGVPLRPHIDATAIALLALQDEERTATVQAGLKWLKNESARIDSAESLAWCILTLFLYQERIEDLKSRLAAMVGNGCHIRNNATLATALLALKCGEMVHPFATLR